MGQEIDEIIGQKVQQEDSAENDRIFKAFGKEINQRYPYQKFYLPKTKENEDI